MSKENVMDAMRENHGDAKTAAQEAPKVAPLHPESATIKFTDLKFGKNYDPTSGQ